MEYRNEEATIICARLVRQGYMKKNEFPNLELDEYLLKEVRDRLATSGLELILNAYSPYYAVRFNMNVQEVLEQSNNLGLRNNEVAMLVILWCKLILPKRLALESQMKAMEKAVAADSANPPGTNGLPTPSVSTALSAPNAAESTPGVPSVPNLPPSISLPPDPLSAKEDAEAASEKKEQDKIFVKAKELWAEYGENFGSKITFKAVLTRLSKLQFIRIHNEVITEGILLDLLIDGTQMADEIKRSALAYKLAGINEDEDTKGPEDDEDYDFEMEEIKEDYSSESEEGDEESEESEEPDEE